MNRRAFVRSVSACLPGVVLAQSSLLAENPTEPTRTPRVVLHDQDRDEQPLSLFQGDVFYTKVSGRDSGGALYIFESTRLGLGGPAEHVHPDQDEWWYILSGEYVMKIGDTRHEIGPGDSVFGPRGIPHAWAKVSEGVGRLLIGFQPAGGMEDYFRAVSAGEVARLSPDEQEQFRKKHGFIRVGPALTFHKQ